MKDRQWQQYVNGKFVNHGWSPIVNYVSRNCTSDYIYRKNEWSFRAMFWTDARHAS